MKCLTESNASTCGHITGSSTTALTFVIYRNNYYDRQHSGTTVFAADSAGTPLLTREITASLLGDAFTQPAAGAYPVLKAFADDAEGRLAAAALTIKDAYTRHNVKESCRLTAPSGVEWSSPHFTIKDGRLSWAGLTAGNSYPVIARCGDLERPFILTVGGTTGVIDLADSDKTPVSTEWYSTDGLRIINPQHGSIVVRIDRYASGRVERNTVVVP